MTIAGPWVVVGLPLVVAVLLQFLRRWTAVAAAVGTLTALLVGGLLAFAPTDGEIRVGKFTLALYDALVFRGRELVIAGSDPWALAFLFFTTAGLLVIAWRLLAHSIFFPVALATTALLAAALLITQVVYVALLIEIAALLVVFPLQASGGRGGLRYMVYTTLALPGLMVTQLLLDLYAIFPNDVGLLGTSAVLLSLSFAILFGAVPFQSWLSTVATDGSPPVVTFIFTVQLGTVWFMLLDYLQTYTWLEKQAALGTVLTNLGLVMVIVGGLLAASQRRLGRLVGYAMLADNGAMLLALGSERMEGMALAMLILMARPLALGLMTLGLQGLRDFGRGSDARSTLLGAAWHVPWRAAAFLFGGVAMAGFPVSLGFAARWGLYGLLARRSLFLASLVLLGGAGVMLGVVAAIRDLLAPSQQGQGRPITVAEDHIIILLIVLLMLAIVVLGLFPQLLGKTALRLAESYTFFR